MRGRAEQEESQLLRYDRWGATLESRGQRHVFRWWPELDFDQRSVLLEEVEAVPWEFLDTIVPTHVLQKPFHSIPDDVQPAPVYPRVPDPKIGELYAKARERGRSLLAAGKVAAFTVAGGQATRLGLDRPKGTVVVTPVGDKTLFECFGLWVKAARIRYGVNVPWYIMTSPANHQDTLDFLAAHAYFGLPPEEVSCFSQGMLPAFDLGGKVLLAEKGRLALAPDGHGGSLVALVRSGALVDMQRRGIEVISYFQVDNPLVKPFDPLFIGLHALTGSEMSTKVSPKADDLEKVGNVCLAEGRLAVIEYSDFPPELAHAKDVHGRRKFNAGNLAIHLLDPKLVDRVVGEFFQMPVRRAEKAVPYIDENGVRQQPQTPNAVKLETFIFDVLPFAKNPLVLEVDRAEEFSPVKNATGTDSLETSKRDQIARACRWLESAGVEVPCKPDGSPDLIVSISPLFALDAEEVRAKLPTIPSLRPGMNLWLE